MGLGLGSGRKGRVHAGHEAVSEWEQDVVVEQAEMRLEQKKQGLLSIYTHCNHVQYLYQPLITLCMFLFPLCNTCSWATHLFCRNMANIYLFL